MKDAKIKGDQEDRIMILLADAAAGVVEVAPQEITPHPETDPTTRATEANNRSQLILLTIHGVREPTSRRVSMVEALRMRPALYSYRSLALSSFIPCLEKKYGDIIFATSFISVASWLIDNFEQI